MTKFKNQSIILLLILIFCSCNKITPMQKVVPKSQGVENTILRAYQLANLKWMPLSKLEYNNGRVYLPNNIVVGVPYSSVKETQTYIGQDISFYTFITALNNPQSLLYTEKLDQSPYNGTNCRLYYGVVCSSAVMYALGISIPYSTFFINDGELFDKSIYQSPENIELCSILLEYGHVSMVVGINRDSQNNITSVLLFDSSVTGTFIKEIDFPSFCKWWNEKQIVMYTYKYFERNTQIIDFSQDRFIYDGSLLPEVLPLCPNKGDMSSYSIKDSIVINILDNNYTHLELFSGDALINKHQIEEITSSDVVYTSLMPGEYKARLSNNDSSTDYVFFEVIDTTTDVTIGNNKIIVTPCSKNGIVDFISINSLNGAYKKISNVPNSKGKYELLYSIDDNPNMNVRVVYRGRYGRVMYQTPIIK